MPIAILPTVTELPLCALYPTTRCACNALLALAAGTYLHVTGTCTECWCAYCGRAKDNCPTPEAHTITCTTPDPIQCRHIGCFTPIGLEQPCAAGHTDCCGCCHEER